MVSSGTNVPVNRYKEQDDLIFTVVKNNVKRDFEKVINAIFIQ